MITMNNNERYRKLVLLHSNDMHGDFLAENVDNNLVGGVSMLSGYISKVKAEEDNVLYCVAGDMFRGSVIDSEFQGVSTIEIMNMLAPDVVTIGNHETDYGLSHLLFIEKCAKFPIINANLYIKMNGTRLFSPYHIVEIGGMKILFIGIITEEVISRTKSEGVIGTLVDINDAAQEVAKICNTFNGIDIDFTVLLTHIGFEQDKQLAARLDPSLGVDVIIGGHSHTFIDEPAKVNDILIVQAGTGTDQIGRFDIVVDTNNNSVASFNWQSVPINADTCPNDPKMEQLVGTLKSKTDLKYGRVLKRLKCVLTNPARNMQTQMGSFIADLFKDMLKCDIMLVGSGSLRVKSLGPIITLQDIIEAYPYREPLYELKATGKQIKDMLTYVYRDETWFEGDHTEFYQISYGLYVEYCKSKHEITKFEYMGKPVEEDKLYTIVIKGYHYNNFKKFFGFELDELVKNYEPKKICTDCAQAIYEYLENCEKLPEYPDDSRLVVYE